ncbi:hypothetical protein R6Q59_015024 [Mikania micrantha]
MRGIEFKSFQQRIWVWQEEYANEVTLENEYNNDDDIQVSDYMSSPPEQFSNAKKYKSKKRKVEPEVEVMESRLMDSINNVANAIQEGNRILERVYHHEYTVLWFGLLEADSVYEVEQQESFVESERLGGGCARGHSPTTTFEDDVGVRREDDSLQRPLAKKMSASGGYDRFLRQPFAVRSSVM